MRYLDGVTKEEVKEFNLLRPSFWLRPKAEVIVTRGKGAYDDTYRVGNIVKVIRRPGKANRYKVEIDFGDAGKNTKE